METKPFTKIFLTLFIAVALISCKKSKDDVSPVVPEKPATATETEKTLDSLFLYAKEVYFWNDAIPSYEIFNPRRFVTSTSDIASYRKELYAISQLKINPLTRLPYEYYGDGAPKYSYISDLRETNPVASTAMDRADIDLESNGNDIGIRPVFYTTNTGAYTLYVTAVYPGSPAATAGLKRGWIINKINGKSIGASFDNESDGVVADLTAASVRISGYHDAEKIPFDITLQSKSYKSSPVYASKVFNKSGKKIGYLSYARFAALTDPTGENDALLDPIFEQFSTEGVTDLIIDLRYNGGGYVYASEHLANLIAPGSLTGKKMFSSIYNTTMQTGKATILAHQPFLTAAGKVQYQNGKMVTYADLDYSVTDPDNNAFFKKKGTLNSVTNVVFLVSGSTASSSELLINSLKPYLAVKIIGETTYGKPIGFFPITLQNRYEVYFSMFETLNSNNEGKYYDGIAPTVPVAFLDPRYEFGDERDSYLSAAMNLLAPATPATSMTATAVRKNSVMTIGNREVSTSSIYPENIKPVNPNSEFLGMVGTKHVPK